MKDLWLRRSAVAVALLLPTLAFAQGWDGGGDGESWCDCDNWSGDTCPDGHVIVVSTGSGDFTLKFDCSSDQTINCLNLDGNASGRRIILKHSGNGGTLFTGDC